MSQNSLVYYRSFNKLLFTWDGWARDACMFFPQDLIFPK